MPKCAARAEGMNIYLFRMRMFIPSGPGAARADIEPRGGGGRVAIRYQRLPRGSERVESFETFKFKRQLRQAQLFEHWGRNLAVQQR